MLLAPAVASPRVRVTPAVCVAVFVYPVQFQDLATAPESMVMSPVLDVKNTSSAAVGFVVSLAPPSVVDQDVSAVQLPVRAYLDATY